MRGLTPPSLFAYPHEPMNVLAAAPASPFADPAARPLDPAKFRDPRVTAKGEPRARVALERLDTLWINTGTLCNLACRSCYIESSPTNDALVYPTLAEIVPYLDEAAALGAREIGFTGGEPFMNRDCVAMIAAALERGFEVLVLTNAMRPMRRFEAALAALPACPADDPGQPRPSSPGRARSRARRRAPGTRRWTACAGWKRTASGPPSPGGSFPARASRRRGAAMPACSSARRSRSRQGWSSSRRWTPRPTCPRSAKPAGTSSTSRRLR